MLYVTRKQLERVTAHAHWQEKLDFYQDICARNELVRYPSEDVAAAAASFMRVWAV